ncbi:MAG TPA: site-2 protease family protein [Burkholderiales bacterium]
MNASLFSALWYRVAEQHPSLRAEVRVQRQQVRDQRWYLLLNAASGRQYRIDQKAYRFVGLCDGQRSVQQIWSELLEHLRDDAPSQDEVIQTLNRLDEHELLAYESVPDVQGLVRRRDHRRQRRIRGFVNPLALRIPIGDPSALLRRFNALPRLIFNRATFWCWLSAIVFAMLSAAINWKVLTAHAVEYMGSPRYLLLAWVSFPLVKAVHELGHALALRRWGGEVHEAGFSFFVLVPAPYVDASAAAAFPSRTQRVIVSAAGIMVELAVAAIALAVWMNVQPGLVRDFAFVTMFVASVSTLVFNGNPLLPFDAYYIVCDALDVPNLTARSKLWWTQVLTSALSGRTAREYVRPARGERKWLCLYAPSSMAYRLFISFLLVVWLGAHSTVLGTVAAAFLILMLILKPIMSTTAAVWAATPIGGARARTAALAAATACGMAAIASLVPLPFHTTASGVVWPPEQARVRAGTEGFVKQILARDGERVSARQVLLVLDDPTVITQGEKLRSRLEQLQAERFSALLNSYDQVRNAEEEITRVESELQRVEERIAELQVRAHAEGTLVLPQQSDLPGTFLRQGSTIGYVLERSLIRVRTVVPEYDAAIVRERTRSVEVRIAGDGQALAAQLERDLPAATYELPSAALGDKGGGPYVTDPADVEGLRTRDPVVLVDVSISASNLQRIGERAWVRFDHGSEPLASRCYRQLRQVFLQHFNPAV